MTDHHGTGPSSGAPADGVASREWLVVLEPGASSTAVPRLREVAQVLHLGGPRLAVVAAPDPGTVRAVEGVREVLGSVPEDLLSSFTEEERLLALAFVRRRAAPAPRPGDGLAWDAPGHRPPDGPPWA